MTPLPRGYVVALGEALVDFVAAGDITTVAESETFHKAAGGAPANVAVGLARLGQPCAFIGKVSSDAFGAFLLSTLQTEGVDTAGVVVDREAQTPLAFVGAGRTTERSFVFYHRGMADTLLRPHELNRKLIAGARILHFGSVMLTAEPARTATLDAVNWARDHGVVISLDPNIRTELWPDESEARKTILSALRLAHVVKVSLEEVRWLTRVEGLAAGAGLLRAHGPQLVVVTLGAEGAYYQTAKSDGREPGVPVDAVDPTGAGDAFVAGLLAELTRGPRPLTALDDPPTLRRALRVAVAAGGLATTGYGAIPSLPRRDDIDRILETRHHTGPIPASAKAMEAASLANNPTARSSR